MNKSEELANENLTASILDRIENVAKESFQKLTVQVLRKMKKK